MGKTEIARALPVLLWAVLPYLSHELSGRPYSMETTLSLDTTTLLIIVVVVLLVGRRWFLPRSRSPVVTLTSWFWSNVARASQALTI